MKFIRIKNRKISSITCDNKIEKYSAYKVRWKLNGIEQNPIILYTNDPKTAEDFVRFKYRDKGNVSIIPNSTEKVEAPPPPKYDIPSEKKRTVTVDVGLDEPKKGFRIRFYPDMFESDKEKIEVFQASTREEAEKMFAKKYPNGIMIGLPRDTSLGPVIIDYDETGKPKNKGREEWLKERHEENLTREEWFRRHRSM